METIGFRIKELRRKDNLSVRYLADYLGTSMKVVYNIEMDETLPNVEIVIALSKKFVVSTDYILLGKLNDKS